jgi:glycosyltransferase involved in cell wall biosynthesis
MRILHVLDTGYRQGDSFPSELLRGLARSGLQQQAVVLNSEERDVVLEAPVVELHKNGSRGIDAALVKSLRRISLEWSPNVIQAHGGDALKYSAISALGHSGVLVHRGMGVAPKRIRSGPRHRMYRWLVRRATKVVAASEGVARDYVEIFGLSSDRVVTIPNAVDPDRLRPTAASAVVRRGLGLPESSLIILSMLPLTWDKNPLAHIEITERVLPGQPDAIHLIIGEGSMRPDLENVIVRRGLTGRVRLLGDREDTNDLLHASDVLLFASKVDGNEGLPSSLIEAGMAGRPVIAYDLSGAREAVIDRQTGVLVSRRDTRGLIAGLSRVLEDGELRAQMGRRAREYCISKFTIEPVSSRYLELYHSLGKGGEA